MVKFQYDENEVNGTIVLEGNLTIENLFELKIFK